MPDPLAHLCACADVWGASIIAMIAYDNPTQRYVSPRRRMKKPAYADPEFGVALQPFTKERQALVEVLTALQRE